MKKLTAFVLLLVCLLSLAGCSAKAKVHNWTQTLKAEDVTSAQAWLHTDQRSEKPLEEVQIRELITRMNALPKDAFTHNKHLRGGTSTYGITMVIDSEVYHLHQANGPYGNLEIEYDVKLWWIDDAELSAYVQTVTDIG